MPDQAVAQRSATGPSPTVESPRFTGRDRELAALASALAGSPAVVIVEGEAGIGKTRLVAEYLATPQGAAHKTLVATCPPFRQPHTLGALADALRQHAAGGVGGLGLSALGGALRPLFPEWADDLPPALELAEDASAARYRVFAALAELLDRLQTDVLVVEDTHWADEATLEFLLYLAARQPRQVSLVVTCRPEYLPGASLLPRLARLATGAAGLRLALDALDVGATAGLMSSMLAGEPVSADFVGLVHERTGGLPLAVEESVRLMADRADLARRGGQWVRRHLVKISVPPSIRDAMLERARRLSADAQVLLRAAAVVAGPAGEQVLAAVAGMDAERARASLSEALDSGLLAEDTRGLVSFRHALAAQALYELIPGPDRRAAHLRAGETLAGQSPPPAVLARHFRESGDTDRWLRYAEEAAGLAVAAGDETTAATLRHDLVTAAGLPQRTVARLAGKIVLLALPDHTYLVALADALRAALGSPGLAPEEEAELRFQLGRLLGTMEEVDASRAELERAVAGLPPGSLQAVRAMTLLGWPQGSDCPAHEHLRWLRRAADAADSVPPAERLRLLVDRAGALLLLGEAAGWAEAARVPWDAGVPGERLQVTRAHSNLGEAAMIWGRYGEAGHRLEHAVRLADSYQFARLRNGALADLAHLDWLTGAWDGLAGRAGALASDEDLDPMVRLEASLVAGLLAAASGDRERTAELLGGVIEGARRRGAAEYLMEPAAALARMYLAGGDVAQALRVTGEPTDVVAGKGTWIWAADLAPARVAALSAAGQAEEAAMLTDAFARGLRGRDAAAAKAGLASCLAILAETDGAHAHAAAQFARVAAAWQALPRPYSALLARERQARCLLAAGQEDSGLALLAEVTDGLWQLGATAEADGAARMLRERGVQARRPVTGRPSYGNRLSPREAEVVRLLVAGKASRQIAAELFLSPKTVTRHLGSAMRKTGTRTPAALAARAVEAGIIPLPE